MEQHSMAENDQQQVMDHKRFEAIFTQNAEILALIRNIIAEIDSMKKERAEARSFAYTSTLLTVLLIATAFVGITAILAFST